MKSRMLFIFLLISFFIGCESESQKPVDGQPAVASDVVDEKTEDVLDDAPHFTPAEQRLAGYEQRQKLQQASLLKQVAFRNVGPTVQSGRAIDLAVNPDDPTIFYVAYASGGLWRTENNGISFKPLFDNQPVMTIGDIAVDWQRGETIWVGTGENNSSRSSYSGTGIYKSTDRGETWQHMGLPETHHIGRIVIHPQDSNTVWVAAIGHLYSDNEERGIYKTTNGGETWVKTLFIDDETGVIDLVISPEDADVLYAAAWKRKRFAWNFVESGDGSGIYKSTDGGESWQLLSTEASGFPTGNGVGRIGLAVSPQNPNLVYAFLDNQYRRPMDADDDKPELTKDQLRTMTKEAFLALEENVITEYLDYYNFPQKYSAASVSNLVADDKITPEALVIYTEDGNRQLFDTPVIGAEVYVSHNAGQSWQKTHEDFIDDFCYSYGYYFGEIRVAATDSNTIYILGVPLLTSKDGGKTFSSIVASHVHVDHHAMWINPKNKKHLILGNDGGINISYDEGKNWNKANTPAVGQFYTVNVDMAEPYNIYGGTQDNGVWVGPSTYEASPAWRASGHYPYKKLLGGDGMQVAIDPRDNETVYTGYQFGYYFRVNRNSGNTEYIKPEHELGERPPRCNWQTPIHLSEHNSDILYFGAEKVYRSMKNGEEWKAISDDLTRGGLKGDVPYGTLTSIDESPLKFGLIYAGSDDGLVHVTKDGGVSWEQISDDVPEHLWVSRVEASPHDEATVFVSLNGYRFDDFTAYLYKSTNYGKDWQRIGMDLPAEPINVVVQDDKNSDILYVGTDHGLYVSLDDGNTFMAMNRNLPATPVHDMVVHPREKDLVVGTHGRSIFIANVSLVQQLTPEVLAQKIKMFPLEKITYNEKWGEKPGAWDEPTEAKLEIPFYLNDSSAVTIRLFNADTQQLIRSWQEQGEPGLNFVDYDLSVDPDDINLIKGFLPDTTDLEVKVAKNEKLYLVPGKYQLELSAGGETVSQQFEIIRKEKQKRGQGLEKKTP